VTNLKWKTELPQVCLSRKSLNVQLDCNPMLRTLLLFMLGILLTALLSNVVTVYVFHDVDADKIGHMNEAFVGLLAESVLFTLIVGSGVGILTLLGGYLLHLKGYRPRAKSGLYLGIGIILFQYPWDFAGRAVFPKLADTFLALYLILAIVVCAIILIHDSLRQMRLCQASGASHDS